MNGKKILVTGSTGMLGLYLINYFKNRGIRVYGSSCDITDIKLINKEMTTQKPDIIIHTAAYTDVDGCEKYIDKAYKINVIGTQNLVNYSLKENILFVYISSTGIYGDYKDTAYTEFDNPKPTSVHHKSKYEAEKILQNHLSKYLIIRTGWLYGGEITDKKNFVYKRYLESLNNNIIYSDDSQTGNPTSINELSMQIDILIKNNQYGIFNCVNEADSVSRYDYVKKIIEFFESQCEVKKAPKELFKRIAKVSKNESAINYKLRLCDMNIMTNWENSLYKYIEFLKSKI